MSISGDDCYVEENGNGDGSIEYRGGKLEGMEALRLGTLVAEFNKDVMDMRGIQTLSPTEQDRVMSTAFTKTPDGKWVDSHGVEFTFEDVEYFADQLHTLDLRNAYNPEEAVKRMRRPMDFALGGHQERMANLLQEWKISGMREGAPRLFDVLVEAVSTLPPRRLAEAILTWRKGNEDKFFTDSESQPPLSGRAIAAYLGIDLTDWMLEEFVW